jgi:hypothetical protein
MWHEVDPHDPFALRRRLIEELWRSALLHRLILAFGELRPFGQPRDAPSSCGPPLGEVGSPPFDKTRCGLRDDEQR